MKSINALYNEILAQNEPICVFDLDSTLFNVSPRSEKILHEFAETHQHSDLLKIKILNSDWGVFETLLRSGYSLEQHSDIYSELKKEWNQKFFSHHYLNYDTPYKGAVHFVQKLEKLNVKIFYLTGRDTFRMGKGTLEVLKKWGFPHNTEQIHLKPYKEMNDELFKLEWMKLLQLNHPESSIYLFENEPVNINLIGQELKDIKLVYMNTTHARIENVLRSHIEIYDYEMES